jgi:hypothetical protein
LASIASLVALLTPVAASAGPEDPHAEVFTGVEAANNAVSGYLGGGYAFGKGLYESGWRLRAVGSLGRYDYQGTLFGGGVDLDTTFDGKASFTAMLVGYQIRRGAVTLKLFAGAEAEDQDISPRDPANRVQGSALASGYRPRAGSTSRPPGLPLSMLRTAQRSKNIGASPASAGGCGRILRSGLKAGRLAMRSMTPDAAAVLSE